MQATFANRRQNGIVVVVVIIKVGIVPLDISVTGIDGKWLKQMRL